MAPPGCCQQGRLPGVRLGTPAGAAQVRALLLLPAGRPAPRRSARLQRFRPCQRQGQSWPDPASAHPIPTGQPLAISVASVRRGGQPGAESHLQGQMSRAPGASRCQRGGREWVEFDPARPAPRPPQAGKAGSWGAPDSCGQGQGSGRRGLAASPSAGACGCRAVGGGEWPIPAPSRELTGSPGRRQLGRPRHRPGWGWGRGGTGSPRRTWGCKVTRAVTRDEVATTGWGGRHS